MRQNSFPKSGVVDSVGSQTRCLGPHWKQGKLKTRIVVAVAIVGLSLVLFGHLTASPCLAQSQSQARLYFFTDHGCAPCRQVEPSIEALELEGYPVETVFLSQQRELGRRFGVDRTPTVVLMTGNQMAGRHAGLIDAVTLKKWFAAVGISAGSNFSSGEGGPVGTKIPLNPKSGKAPLDRARPGFSSSTMHKGTSQPRNAVERIAFQATVKLKVEDPGGISYATGTVIHSHQGESLVMTCGHVFREAGEDGVITAEYGFERSRQDTAPGQLIFFDAGARDIALVAIRTSRPIDPVKIASRETKVQKGLGIFSIGCDHGDDPTIRHSQIKNRAAYDGAIKYDIYGRPVDGRSGGGLFSEDGELIGVCNAAAVEVDEGIYTALDTLYWQLAKVNLEHLFEDLPQSIAPGLAQARPSMIRPKSELRQLGHNLVSVGQPRQASNVDKEVIIIVRSKTNSGEAQTITVSDPGPQLLDYLKTMNNSETRQLDMAQMRELN